MHFHFLFQRLPGLSPEAKFVLLKCLEHYGASGLSLRPVVEVARDLGFEAKITSKVLGQLSKKGYLKKVKINVQVRGRCPVGFLCLEKFMRLQKGLAETSQTVPHEILISELIGSDADSHQLSLANKLFLAVLLAHADDAGVVRDIGTADLMALTGMGRDRIGYQIDSLKQQGYIRSSVSGVTMPCVFGASPGFIFLNLKHSRFKEGSYRGVSVLLLAEFKHENNFFREAQWIFDEVKLLLANTDEDVSDQRLKRLADSFKFKGEINDIPMFFSSIKSTQEVTYLQVKLNDYASHLLSHFWEELKEWNWDSDVIIDRVRNDVSRKSTNKKKRPEFAQEKLDSLAKFLFSVALTIAKQAQRLLLSAGNYPYSNMASAILPYSIGYFRSSPKYTIDLCIEMFSQEIDENLGYIKLGGKHFRKLAPVEQGVEEDLTFETRCLAGLISRNYSQ